MWISHARQLEYGVSSQTVKPFGRMQVAHRASIPRLAVILGADGRGRRKLSVLHQQFPRSAFSPRVVVVCNGGPHDRRAVLWPDRAHLLRRRHPPEAGPGADRLAIVAGYFSLGDGTHSNRYVLPPAGMWTGPLRRATVNA